MDQDGFGDDATGAAFCLAPPNMVAIGGDCNDNNNTIYPGATEICDGFDNNCNGTNDEGLIFNTYYFDGDNDQYGAGIGMVTCQVNPLPGYVLVNGDCDDANAAVYPGATEILENDIDENCDGVDGYLGLSDLAQYQVGLVPNPSNGAFAVQFNTEVVNANIQVTDMNGKVLFQQIMNGTSLEVSNLRLSTGAYLVHVTLENQKEILRLIIQ
ncbi:MAG: MopE-related protein [Crocinitomicaceae bacterium]